MKLSLAHETSLPTGALGLAIAPDGSRAYASCADGARLATVTGQYIPGGWKYEPAPETEPSVKIFDTLTGDRVAAFSHTPPVLSCAFTPDGRHVAAANMMGEVRIWDLQSPGEAKPAVQWTSPDFTSWGSIKTHHYCGGI